MRKADDRRSHSPATRRNGALQSCEPCRRSKQRCDHERPVCRRCTAKKIPDRCFYHPAPMTRRRTSAHDVLQAVSSSRLTSQPNSTASSPGPLASGRLFAPLEAPSALPGYLGSTSYTAILAEHRNEIPYEPEESVDTRPILSVEPDRIQSGVDVLLFLYDLKIRQDLIDRFYHRTWNVVVPKIVIEAIMKSINDILDNVNQNDLRPQLQDLATRIFQNTSRSMTAHASMTVEEYCASFTGPNLRWEVLGIIISLCGQQLVVTPDDDPEFTQASDDPGAKDRLLEQVTVASTICLSFCDQASSANEILAFLQCNDLMLRTQQYGDSSYQAWRRLGDLVATIYAAGLHLDPEGPDNRPFFLRQWRRGCFAASFYMDKMMATFVGRPPLMNQRFCTLIPPLDLSDEVLVAGGDTLDKAIDQLDSSGWNTHGARYRMTSTRVRFQLAIYREQTLEIALGPQEPHDLIRKSNEIEERAKIVWESTPDSLRYDRQPNNDFHGEWLNIIHLYLHYVYTSFLLQRALTKHTDTSQEALYTISRRILTIVNSITSIRNPMVDLDRHFSWIALTYGLPSASVLLLELLHQSHDPGPHRVFLPRAELIRNLSVFISLLSWVSRPGHGNYHTCKEAEKNLSRILDRLLDPQPVLAETVHDVTSDLSTFLNWSQYQNWDFNSELLPTADGFAP